VKKAQNGLYSRRQQKNINIGKVPLKVEMKHFIENGNVMMSSAVEDFTGFSQDPVSGFSLISAHYYFFRN
jgi:hypothetical protein